MESNDSTQDTLAHRQMVIDYATDVCSRLMERSEQDNPIIADYAADFCDDIMKRAERHDESKLHEPEKERFDYVGTHQHLGKYKYGSDEYKKSLEYLGPALQHHYEVNDHHPEHFANGIDGMNLMQLMIAGERLSMDIDHLHPVKIVIQKDRLLLILRHGVYMN